MVLDQRGNMFVLTHGKCCRKQWCATLDTPGRKHWQLYTEPVMRGFGKFMTFNALGGRTLLLGSGSLIEYDYDRDELVRLADDSVGAGEFTGLFSMNNHIYVTTQSAILEVVGRAVTTRLALPTGDYRFARCGDEPLWTIHRHTRGFTHGFVGVATLDTSTNVWIFSPYTGEKFAVTTCERRNGNIVLHNRRSGDWIRYMPSLSPGNPGTFFVPHAAR